MDSIEIVEKTFKGIRNAFERIEDVSKVLEYLWEIAKTLETKEEARVFEKYFNEILNKLKEDHYFDDFQNSEEIKIKNYLNETKENGLDSKHHFNPVLQHRHSQTRWMLIESLNMSVF